MIVQIDPHSGFCGGVIRAIGAAEGFLREHPGEILWSLGEIVHNEAELARLHSLGLRSLQNLDERTETTQGDPLLIRAHGEPPITYLRAKDLGFKVIDCTCPVVLRLQKAIREAYRGLKSRGGTLVLFGKVGHPEVLGLMGQVGGDVVLVPSLGALTSLVCCGGLDTSKDIELFSQTTMSPSEYSRVADFLVSQMKSPARVEIHRTICSQVASRHEGLSEFARTHDVIVFVSGETSSNGKVLFELCHSENPRSYHISSPEALQATWFEGAERVGVCGATSTPKWLLEKVAQAIQKL